MNAKIISAGEFFSFGWKKTKKFFVYFFCLLLLIFSVNALLSFFDDSTTRAAENIFIFDILSCFFDLIAGLGFARITLDICDGKTPTFSSFFSNFRFFLNYSAGFILFTLLITFGMFLLIIPGIIWFIQFQFFGYLIIDKNLGPIEAFKESARITTGIKLQLLGFAVLMGLINCLGFLVFGIGIMASIPTTLIAHAALYKKLASNL